MATRRTLLNTFSKRRLRLLAQRFKLGVSSAARKSDYVTALLQSRQIKTEDILQRVPVGELKSACTILGIDMKEDTKAFLMALLIGSSKLLLRARIVQSLKQQGFRVTANGIDTPSNLTKDRVRELHAMAVTHRRSEARQHLEHHEAKLLKAFANGRELCVQEITPRLVEVERRSDEELLFRYIALHWSIPVSSGYGRRLRFLVVDDSNSKVMGIIGLGDPIFSLASRDNWIGWDKAARAARLHNVMDAFVLGAVPPYSFLLGGKLVAMLAASDQVRQRFKEKYGGKSSVIGSKNLDGDLAILTTSSALGRSAIYNRLRYRDELLYRSVGFTRGSGDFHFLNGVYKDIGLYAQRHCDPTAKREEWGTGFRNRREVVKKCLTSLGVSPEWLYHGVQREVFVVPLATNARDFLRGDSKTLDYSTHPVTELSDWFKQRWLLPRSERDKRYVDFVPGHYTLWPR